MEERINSVQVVILWLSLTSVTTENLYNQAHPKSTGNSGNEKGIQNEVVPPPPLTAFPSDENREKLQGGNVGLEFWEESEVSRVNLYDGNRPDDGTMLTHDHVDRMIGAVPPTKRVKKILPPFESAREKNLSKREASKKIIKSSIEKAIKEEKNEEKKRKFDNGLSNENGKPETTSQAPKNEHSKVFSFERGEKTSTPLPDSNISLIESENEIQGILLVPSEHDAFSAVAAKEEDEEEEEEDKIKGEENEEEKDESKTKKSIWDLLKEREEFRESDILDEGSLDTFKNESEFRTTPEIRSSEKNPFDHFDADSEEIERKMRKNKIDDAKGEMAESYALPWLSSKIAKSEFEPDVGNKNNGSDAWLKNMKEMAKLLELARDEFFPDTGSISVIVNDDNLNGNERSPPRPGKWFLFLLAGNLTIIQLRRQDFTKYLKVNLAARLSIEYDDVRVNKLVLIPPKILVNVTVFAPWDHFGDRGEKSLVKMTETNATLLELSGEEYHLVRFFSIDSLKPEAHKRVKSPAKTGFLGDVEFIFYTFLGSCCACALILLFLVSVNKYFRKVADLDWPWLDLGSGSRRPERTESVARDDFNRISPSVIFSRRFSENRGDPSDPAPWTELESPSEPPWRTRAGVPVPAAGDPEEPLAPAATKLHIYNCDPETIIFPTSFEENSNSNWNLKADSLGSSRPPEIRPEKSAFS